MSTWPTLAAIVAWLDKANGTSETETVMRLLKVTAEAGEAADAYAGMTGQNPRKGVTHSREDVAAELCDVALTALVALFRFTDDPEATFREHLAKVAARAGVTPVPMYDGVCHVRGKSTREVFTPVQGPVKECPCVAPDSTESAETPPSRVSVPPEGAEGISEPSGAGIRKGCEDALLDGQAAELGPETRSDFETNPALEHQPQSPPQSDLRRRYADALSRSLTSPQRGIADHLDAVLAVRDDELTDARAANARVRVLHSKSPYRPGFCYCANPYPCPTIRVLDGAAVSEQTGGGPEGDEPLRHVGGNAEDCPACDGRNLPYPFICPGEEQTGGGDE